MQTWILIALAVLATVILYLLFQRKPAPTPTPAEPSSAPLAPVASGVAKIKQALQVTDKELDAYLADANLSSVVLFYSPGCGYCKSMMPAFDKYGEAAGVNTHVLKVDCSRFFNLAERYKIEGYPTIKLFQGGKAVKDYEGDRSIGSLMVFNSGN